VYAASIFYGQVRRDKDCVYRMISNALSITKKKKAKPSQDIIEKLSKVLNVPTVHLTEEIGEGYYPTRGG
jgi:adenosyl cobinamide kinase/adenosyl cobinamide phosphate guanylyltransferase